MDALNLDADFNKMMSEIKNNISFLENELDMMAICCWITKLTEPACDIEDKARRNEYLSYLLYLLKRRTIHQPFVDEPPSGPLPPLNIDMGNTTVQKDSPADETQFYSPEASTFSYETPQAYLWKTPQPMMSSATPARPPYSAVGHALQRGPTSASTQFSSRPSSRHNARIKRSSGENKFSPCSPCEKIKMTVLERPGATLVDQQKRACLFSRSEHPPPPPPAGYLDYSNEVDDQPFMPPLPGSEQASEEMSRIIESVDKCTRLFDFIRLIAPTTCDQGQLLNFVATAELAQFKEFVQSMFRARMQDTEELLGKEQVKLKERYEAWESAVLRRAQTGVRSLKRLLPEFKYELYERDSEYLYLLLREQFSVQEDELNPQIRVVRIKAQKKRWLTDEAERKEKDNEDRMVELKELNEQFNQLSKCFNAQHKDFIMRNRCLEEKAAKLRIQFHQNQKLVDTYIDQLNTEPTNY